MSEKLHLDRLRQAAQAAGLAVRGAFHPLSSDGVPALPDGTEAATLVLLGGIGGSLWPHFRASPEAQLTADALDTWTRRVAGELAAMFGATAVYPFGGPPYLPFQRWAMRAEPVHVSPLGLLIHPQFGLWHAYRAALLLAERLDLPAFPSRASPCSGCADKPCLSACPAGAFTADGYDVARCARHITSPQGDPCMDQACLARRACPVGAAYAYGLEQSRFHMSAFRRARQAEANQRRGEVPERA
jgi:hypothetical protein